MGYHRGSRSYGPVSDFIYACLWFLFAGKLIYLFYNDAHRSWLQALIVGVPVLCLGGAILYLIVDHRRTIADMNGPNIWNVEAQPKPFTEDEQKEAHKQFVEKWK